VPPLASKLKSLAVLFAGVAASLVLLLLIAAATGQGKDLVQDSRQLFVTSVERLQTTTHENRLQHRLTHLRYISAGLGVSLLAVISWSFFRPAGSSAAINALTREDAEGILRRHAASSEDYFKLWPDDKLYFTIPGIEGFIAYKKVGATVFALADPVSAPHDRPQLLARFMEFCRGRGWSVCFLLINPGSVGLYEQVGLNVLGIGSSAVVPVRQFVESTLKDKWWRWQTNRAKKAGMQYEIAYPPHNETLLRQTAALSQLWLQRAGHTEQGFALGFYDESYLQECTLHLLRNGSGELVAFTNQLPIYNDLRQTTVDMIRFRPDVNGAMPVLIAHILAGLSEAGQFNTFDLGFVPLAKVENVVAKIARRLAVGRFSAAGLEQFKDKFRPEWQPQFLAYDGDLVDLAALFTRLQKAMKVE